MRKLLGIVLGLALFVEGAHASDNTQEKALENLKAQFELIDANRIDHIGRSMMLEPKVSERFWQLHHVYMQKQMALRDKQLALLTRYADIHNRKAMDDALAKDMLKESMRYEAQHVRNRQDFMRDIAKVLTPTQRLRFYQLDLLLDTRLRSGMLAQIPVTE